MPNEFTIATSAAVSNWSRVTLEGLFGSTLISRKSFSQPEVMTSIVANPHIFIFFISFICCYFLIRCRPTWVHLVLIGNSDQFALKCQKKVNTISLNRWGRIIFQARVILCTKGVGFRIKVGMLREVRRVIPEIPSCQRQTN